MQNVVIRAIERLDFRTKEAYKTLRTNLSFAGKNVKVISLTSCTPNEGKTSVSFQLCLSLAESGKQTILVDADLRKSVLGLGGTGPAKIISKLLTLVLQHASSSSTCPLR